MEPATVAPEELAMVADIAATELLPRAEHVRRAGDVERAAALEEYRFQLELIVRAAAAIGLAALQDAGARVLRDVERARAAPPGPGWAALLVRWTAALPDYLRDPTGSAAGLADATADPGWVHAADATADALAERLAAVRLAGPVEQRAARKTTIEPEDVSLAFGDDVLPEVRDSLLRELPGRCEEFTARIDAIVAGGSAEDVDVARRIAHTLKGDGNIVGVRGIATLTHALEDILLALAAAPGAPEPALARVLQEAADCLGAMSDFLLGLGEAPADAAAVLAAVLEWANTLAGGAGSPRTPIAAPHPAQAAPAAGEAPSGAPGASVRVDADRILALLQVAGQTGIRTHEIESRAARLARHLAEIQDRQRLLDALVLELQTLVEIRGVGAVRTGEGSLDALEMERFSELHTVTQRLVEAAQDARTSGGELRTDLAAIGDLVEQQAREQLRLQEQLLGLRSLPVATIAPRLQRAVRQAARMLGKSCELAIDGGDTPLDADRLQALIEPLTHLLRNAVDHGIEAADVRAAAGKPAAGALRIAARTERGLFVLQLDDDGAGLDLEAIRRRGIELGLIAADAPVSERELSQLIFAPGFSTRRDATQVSGRGLGMDIALRRLTELNGSLEVRSRPGAGCTVEIRLPVTHLLAQVVLVEADGAPWAALVHGVERIEALRPALVRGTGPEARLHLDGQVLALWTLEQGQLARSDRHDGVVLLAAGEPGSRLALAVDRVLGARSVLVQDLGPWMPPLPGVLGAAVQGDGRIAPVLDLQQLTRDAAAPTLPRRHARQASALVVDDSLSARRSLEELLQDSGFAVRTARDGLEAVTLLREQVPDVLLVDLEMPRMNGLELTSFVRNSPEIAALPVIMITSRNSSRHQELARDAGVDELLTKPYADLDLLALLERKLRAPTAAAA